MHLAIDWVSAAIIGAAFLFSQVRQVPPRVRYFVVAGALLVVAFYRWKIGGGAGGGFNALVPIVALALAVYHLVKGFRSPR